MLNIVKHTGSVRKLEWLEVGRGFAALVVMLSHTYALDDAPNFLLFFGAWGKLGVAFFFILSGFIICHVHAADIGKPRSIPNFAYRRALRILPTYWLVLFASLAVRQFLGNPDYRLGIDFYFVAKQIFLIDPTPFIEVAWTLRHECLFYVLFLTVLLDVRFGIAVFSIWMIAIVSNADWMDPCQLITAGTVRCGASGGSTSLVLSLINIYFLVGAGIAAALYRGSIGAMTATFSILAASFYMVDYISNSVYAFALMQFFFCSAVVTIAVWLSSRNVTAPPVCVWFGAISYPLYLVHLLAFLILHGIVKRLSLPFPAWLCEITFGVSLTIFLSWIISEYFERSIFRAAKPSPLAAMANKT